MKEFFVGLLVILALLVLSIVGMFLFPFILVLSFFLRIVIYVGFVIFAVWLVGRVTLWGIDRSRQ